MTRCSFFENGNRHPLTVASNRSLAQFISHSVVTSPKSCIRIAPATSSKRSLLPFLPDDIILGVQFRKNIGVRSVRDGHGSFLVEPD